MRPDPGPPPGGHTSAAPSWRHAEHVRTAVARVLVDDPVLRQCGITHDRVLADPTDRAPDSGYYLRLAWAAPHGSPTTVLQRLSVSVHGAGAVGPSSATTLAALLDRVVALLSSTTSRPLTRIALRARSANQAHADESATFDVLSHTPVPQTDNDG